MVFQEQVVTVVWEVMVEVITWVEVDVTGGGVTVAVDVVVEVDVVVQNGTRLQMADSIWVTSRLQQDCSVSINILDETLLTCKQRR